MRKLNETEKTIVRNIEKRGSVNISDIIDTSENHKAIRILRHAGIIIQYKGKYYLNKS